MKYKCKLFPHRLRQGFGFSSICARISICPLLFSEQYSTFFINDQKMMSGFRGNGNLSLYGNVCTKHRIGVSSSKGH